MPIDTAEPQPIGPYDIGTDEDLARRILIRARRVAPCIHSWPGDSELRVEAIAVLKGVYARAAQVGTGVIASQSRNGTSISLRAVESAWTVEDLDALRSLCELAPTERPGLPQGSFPLARPLSNLFPEGEYS